MKLSCSTTTAAIIATLLFLSLTVGLNLGIHGALHRADPSNYTPGALVTNNRDVEPEKESNVPSKNIKLLEEINSPFSKPSERALVVADKVHPTAKSNGDNKNLDSTTIKNDLKILKEISVLKPEPTKPPASVVKDISSLGPIEKYITEGRKIPILLVTCNRPDLLKTTLNSLLSVRGVSSSDIVVIQDGNMAEVAEIVKRHNLKLIQNTAGLRLRGGAAGMDGGSRIATHYKFSLTNAFAEFNDAPAMIVVEDDLLFSPDFHEYFQTVSPIIEHDSTVFVVSAWNDNGFAGKVKDPYKLERTGYFPGLGWLVSRSLYKNELEMKWPSSHWDHWLRSAEVSKYREIVHPEIPRTFHNGIKGTFMDIETHNRYFRDIAYNTDPSVSWEKKQKSTGQALFEDVILKKHEENLAEEISECIHANSVRDVISAPAGSTVCIWIDVIHEMETSHPPFYPIATFFGIWHEHRRSAHYGLHSFYWLDKYILLLNVQIYKSSIPTYSSMMPKSARIIQPTEFDTRMLQSIKLDSTLLKEIIVTPALIAGIDCDSVCKNTGSTCSPQGFSLINNCDKLKSSFDCSDCIESYGFEQPAFVVSSHTENAGMCLFSSDASKSRCSSLHSATIRLCPCVKI